MQDAAPKTETGDRRQKTGVRDRGQAGVKAGVRQGSGKPYCYFVERAVLDDDSVFVYWYLRKANNKSLALFLIESRP